MNDRLQRLQEQAKKRNAGNYARQSKQKVVYLKKRNNDRKPAAVDYRALLAGQGLIMAYLVISYRPDPNNEGLYIQGSWKQFRVYSEAQGWLLNRSRTGARLYQGMVTYASLEQILQDYADPDLHHSIWLALRHYLDWRVSGL